MANTANNRGIALGLITALDKRDQSELEERLSVDAVLDFPGIGRVESRKRIITFFKALFRKYPRLNFFIQDIVVDEDRACVIWENTGIRTNGDAYHNQGITYFHMANGKIDFVSDYFKDTSFVTK